MPPAIVVDHRRARPRRRQLALDLLARLAGERQLCGVRERVGLVLVVKRLHARASCCSRSRRNASLNAAALFGLNLLAASKVPLGPGK